MTARAYIQHEDQLVNNRTSWMLTVNGLLFAALGVILPKIVDESVLLVGEKAVPANLVVVSLYCFFVFCLCVVGAGISQIGHDALKAAYQATAAIKDICNHSFSNGEIDTGKQKYEVCHCADGKLECDLPMLTRGGVIQKEDSTQHIRYGYVDLLIVIWWVFGLLDIIAYVMVLTHRHRI
jgi:hypothetical protein